ncbi:MAG: RNA 3'-terminal phosphate cyclase [Gammaproteobacteria bacterium]
MDNVIELNGSQGEGGGQILRTALTLSTITGKPFRISNIRAKRSKPGLLRQHLTAVQAAAEICNADVEGAATGSQTLLYKPGRIKGGDYRYAIGTAGSCTLVLQTILPALWFADAPSSVTVSGGTHNTAAPPADFLIAAWLPLMRRMGVEMDIELLRHGFYPAGGGEVRARIMPVKTLLPLDLSERGALLRAKAVAVVAGLSIDIAKRELQRVERHLDGIETEMQGLSPREGPGNVLMIAFDYEHCSEVFTGFGEKGVPAETVADRVAEEARRYRDSSAAVGEHLADQLVLPIALAGKGSFTTTTLSSHLHTNSEVIGKFLPVTVQHRQSAGVYLLKIESEKPSICVQAP